MPPITAPFNLGEYRRNRAYIDQYDINGGLYSLEEILNFLGDNINPDAVIFPEYDNEAEALADGIQVGDRWKYKRNNSVGMPAGVVVQQVA